MNARRLVLIPLALAAVLASAMPAGAQTSTSGLNIRQVDTSAFPTVAVTVSADNGLSPSSVKVTENGKPATVVSNTPLAQSGGSFDVVLSIDTSDSVKGAPLQAAVAAAESFVRHLDSQVPVGLLTFSNAVRVMQPITTDHAAVLKAIGSLGQTTHGTLLYDSVPIAVNMFSGTAQHNIVLLTDGSDVGSSGSLADAVASAKGAKVGVFTVGLGPDADTAVLKTMAAATGGGYVAAAQSNLSAIYQQLAAELSHQFVLVYHSTGAAGAAVSVGVQSGSSTDRSLVLLPRSAAPATTGGGGVGLSLTGNLALTVVLVALFLGLFLAAMMLIAAPAQARRQRELARRMAAPQADDASKESERQEGATAWLPHGFVRAAEQVARAGGVQESLERRLERAGVAMTAGEFMSLKLLAVFIGLVVGIVLQSWWVGVILVVAGALIPNMLLRRTESKRIEQLHQQLPDVLMILASSLRAGHSFLQALDTASKEVGPPSSPEFARVVAEIRLGRPPHEALNGLAERVGTEEFKWAVLGINVQREIGGNLAEILDTLAETVRDRDGIRRQVRALSAEARLSMKIMVALPPLLVLYMLAVNPDYMRLLWTTTGGWVMIGVGAVLMVAGVLIMRKLVKIRV